MERPSRLRIERLHPTHDRTGFTSGAEELDRYLRVQAGQEAKRHIAAPFVLLDPTMNGVAGYYTLSAFTLKPGELPPDLVRKLPRYPLVPATLLGRLAVTRTAQGKGYGQLLLLDALQRTLDHASDIATIGVVVEARDARAQTFYERYDFRLFPSQARRLFLPLTTMAKLFSRTDTTTIGQ